MKHVYLSPHFGDAVLSCGGAMHRQAGGEDEVLVVTVFAPLSPQDPERDRKALSALKAGFEHWNLSEEENPKDPLPGLITAKLKNFLDNQKQPLTLYVPLGVGNHADACMIRDAILKISARDQVLFYEEQPSIAESPLLLCEALYPNPEFWWEPMTVSVDAEQKMNAARLYQNPHPSQEAVSAYAKKITGEAGEGERFWRRRSRPREWNKNLLVCPLCKGAIKPAETSFKCASCGKEFPIHFGIADLRTFDPSKAGYKTGQEDMKEAAQLWAISKEKDFEGLIRFRFEQYQTAEKLITHYIKYRLDIRDRVIELINKWVFLPQELSSHCAVGKGLDIGCGAGVGLFALLALSPQVVGIDISFIELVCTRKFLEEYGMGNFLVLTAACAEALPFQDKSFARISARDVYEHVPARREFLKESYRILDDRGAFLANTFSRFVWQEPHVLLKGLGFLPRFLQPAIVRLFRKRGYDIFLPTLWEFKHEIRQALPKHSPFIVKSAVLIRKEKVPQSWKGRLGRKVPFLVDIINTIYRHVNWFELVVVKPKS